MSYIALYRKWRPAVFEDVVEQEHVVKTLKYSVSTGRIAHAYLFCGTRGTGKTTMAHIMSRAINCLQPRNGDPCNECEICRGILSGSILDVLEIDAASNNSVDNIREIRDEVIYAPSHAKYKVYIIDEVHMLSTGAFNALLKTLEEPPAHVVFILATTEPHKLPATILSRCQRFDFRRISVESIMDRLKEIAGAGGVEVHQDALRLIARMADGALRDAISLLDQCMSLGAVEITYNDVLSVIGIVHDAFIADMVEAVKARDIAGIVRLIDKLVMEGKNIAQFVSDLVLYFRNLLICKITDKPEEIIEASRETLDVMKCQSVLFDRDTVIFIMKELSSLETELKWAVHPRILLEVSLVRLCENESRMGSEDVLERLAALERKISSGDFAVRASAQGSTAQESQKAAPGPAAGPERQKPGPHGGAGAKGTPAAEAGRKAGGGKNLECWPQVINEMKSLGRMVIYTNLLGSRAVELNDGLVGIVFSGGSSFCKMLVSKAENLEVVESVVSKKLGREVRVKCVDEEDLAQDTGKKEDTERDELVEKGRDIASRLNVPFNVIDE